jgi:quercetin dioxygenase-like cupin family protein
MKEDSMKFATALVTIMVLMVLPAIAQQPGHSMTAAADVAWRPGPASLPQGSEMAVLRGNPSEAGVFTMRLRLPVGYAIQPHWHPAVEHVTVIEGSFLMGLGETFDRTAMHELGAGGFFTMDPGTRHFAAAGANGAVLQLHGMGPWQVYYVNRANDPRGAAAPTPPNMPERPVAQKE